MNFSELDVLLSPAEYKSLPELNLSQTCCVVFDVLRATSAITVALANGAKEILPCATIEEAIAARKSEPKLILAGERKGQRINSKMSNGVEFDLGNSPREMTRQHVFGKKIATTTTNGTNALKACSGAGQVLIGSFINISILKKTILNINSERLLIVCAGTGEGTALEDTLGAGALCNLLWQKLKKVATPSAHLAYTLYRNNHMQLLHTVSGGKNARHLLTNSELAPDVQFCIKHDTHPVIGKMNTNGWITV